jgi:hypothetical protein
VIRGHEDNSENEDQNSGVEIATSSVIDESEFGGERKDA